MIIKNVSFKYLLRFFLTLFLFSRKETLKSGNIILKNGFKFVEKRGDDLEFYLLKPLATLIS